MLSTPLLHRHDCSLRRVCKGAQYYGSVRLPIRRHRLLARPYPRRSHARPVPGSYRASVAAGRLSNTAQPRQKKAITQGRCAATPSDLVQLFTSPDAVMNLELTGQQVSTLTLTSLAAAALLLQSIGRLVAGQQKGTAGAEESEEALLVLEPEVDANSQGAPGFWTYFETKLNSVPTGSLTVEEKQECNVAYKCLHTSLQQYFTF